MKTSKKFSELIRPLTDEEYADLEASIKEHGVRDPIVTWRDIVCDGHNRWSIAKKLKKDFQVSCLDAKWTEDQVVEWILKNQLARRNVTPQERSYLRGKLYNETKQNKDENLSMGQNDPSEKTRGKTQKTTAKDVSEKTGVSEKTVKRDAVKAEALDKLPDYVRAGIVSGKIKATEKAILKAAEIDPADRPQLFRPLRVGQETSLDKVLRDAPKKGKIAGPSKRPEKSKVTQISTAKLHDSMIRKYVSPLVRALDNLATSIGKRGENFRTANASLNQFIKSLKLMREGKP